MRTPRPFYPKTPTVYTCELDLCPHCGGSLQVAYVSGSKTVQTLTDIVTIAQRAKRCAHLHCAGSLAPYPSAQWQQIAPRGCTYGYDVIAYLGWYRQTHRQTFAALQATLPTHLQLSESHVRYLYHHQYLPLLACPERTHRDRLNRVADQGGLILSLDGLAPEGGEPQLWVVRELQTQLTLRSGWLSQQDETAFVNFLQPIRDLGLPVVAILSDKQQGLLPAVGKVFPHVRHAFCQLHYLKNAATPVAEADETMKITLRQEVRKTIGPLIRQEQAEKPGVLTVTGLLPSPVPETPRSPTDSRPSRPEVIAQERAAIVQDLQRRLRYLLTLKGRPPFRLAGIEMFERLTEVKTCLETLIRHQADPRWVHLQVGLQAALATVHADYTDLHQAAAWLDQLAEILDPEGKPARTAAVVQAEWENALHRIQTESAAAPRLHRLAQRIMNVSESYAPGLFHTYAVADLPRTNNARESEFRDLNRRLLMTTGQKGGVRRLLQRAGAWELIPRPNSLPETIRVLSQVKAEELREEQQRVHQHRNRFRLHTRSAKQSQKQLKHLEQRWAALPSTDSS